MDLMLYSSIYDVHLSTSDTSDVVSSHLWKLYFFIKWPLLWGF